MRDEQQSAECNGDVLGHQRSRAVVSLKAVSKHYPVFRNNRQKMKWLCSSVLADTAKALEGISVVKALDGISLQIKAGEKVGIVGRNGAGKSTLLKLLAGGFPPTIGELEVRESLYSLLPGSVGFDPELSVYENARMYLIRYGFSEEILAEKLREIEEFVELGVYFYQPLKNGSLGMRVRSEFATATTLNAGIIMIDEVLGAGDIYWAEKCAKRMDALCSAGRTLLLVSHSLDQIMQFCDRCVWIDQGRVIMDGDCLEVIKRYEGFLERLSWHSDDIHDKQLVLEDVVANLGNVTLPGSGQEMVRWPGRGDVLFSGVWVNGAAVNDYHASQDEELNLKFYLSARASGVYNLRYLMTFWSRSGKRMAVVENVKDSVVLEKGEQHAVELHFSKLQLGEGEYHVTFSLFKLASHEQINDESTARLDVLYKSLKLVVVKKENSTKPKPAYKIALNQISGDRSTA